MYCEQQPSNEGSALTISLQRHDSCGVKQQEAAKREAEALGDEVVLNNARSARSSTHVRMVATT